MTGHRYGNKEFDLVPDQWFDMAFLFNKYSFDDEAIDMILFINI